MGEEQSWFNCKYALGNLDLKVESLKNHPRYNEILKAFDEENEYDKLVREEGIHRFYHCIQPEMVHLGVYHRDGVPNEEGGYTQVVQLLGFYMSEWYEAGADPLGEHRWRFELWIQEGGSECVLIASSMNLLMIKYPNPST